MKVFARYYLPVVFLGERTSDEWWMLAEALSVIRKELPEADLSTIGWDLNPQIKMTARNGQSASIRNSCLVGLTVDQQRIIIRSWANDRGITNARRALGGTAARVFRDWDCFVAVSIARNELNPDGLTCCLVIMSDDPGGDIESVFTGLPDSIVGWPK